MATVCLDLDEILNPYPAQRRFIGSDAFWNMFCGGVGSGKTQALIGWIIRRVLLNPGSVGALLGRTSRDILLMYDEKLKPALDRIQEATGVCLVRTYDRGNARVIFVNGTILYLRSFNRVDKLAGATWTFCGCDESDHGECDPEALWTMLAGRMRGQGPCPGVAFATSPRGLRGTVKRFYDAQNAYRKAVQEGDFEGIRKWSRFYTVTATSFQNPHNPPDFEDSLRSMNKRQFQQAVLGKVLMPLNVVLALDPHHHIDWDWRAHRNLPWILGVDWGGQDHHCALMIQVDRADPMNPRYVVARELIGDGMPRGKFQKLLADWITEAGSDPILAGVDRAAPGENTILQTRLRSTSIRWMHSRDAQKVTTGIEHVRDLLDPQAGLPKLAFAKNLAQVTVGPTAPIVSALRNYVFHLDSSGIPTEIPNKDNVNDHMPDALRYALMSAKDFPAARI